MKFAIACLLAAVSADQIEVIENIKFNREGLDNAITHAEVSGKALAQENKERNIANGKALVHAYSQYQVEDYVARSKTWTPLLKFDVEMIEAYSPADAAKCDQKALTDCYNTLLLQGQGWNPESFAPKSHYMQCVRKAGCENNAMNMNQAQKEALAKQYNTSVGTVMESYKRMNARW
jgi:hypothetical protein